MLSFVTCRTCGNHNIAFGDTSVTVNYNKSERVCDKCNNIHTESHSDFFCSKSCFTEWMIKEVESNKGCNIEIG